MKRSNIILLFLLVLLFGVTLYVYNPLQYTLMPKCPLKMLTGLSCPVCGLQRALHAFMHGHFLEAISYNLFLTIAIPYIIALVVARWVGRGKPESALLNFLEGKVMTCAIIVLFFLWFIVRNLLHI